MLTEQKEVFDRTQRIVQIFKSSKGHIRPHFILTGPSGSGKSFLAEFLAEQAELHFVEINAAQLTKEGTSGNSLSKTLGSLRAAGGGMSICFVDEFDKLFISGNSNSELAHETTNGVQNEFLKLLESKTTEVYGDYGKYVQIPVDKVLFVFAGAFNGEENITLDRLRAFGLKTEFLGRVGLVYNLPKLSLESMRLALEDSRLLANYLKLFRDRYPRTEVIKTIMAVVERAYERNTLGIRMLNTLIHQYFIYDGKLPEATAASSTFQEFPGGDQFEG